MKLCQCVCGHSWKPFVRHPKRCPKCSRREWWIHEGRRSSGRPKRTEPQQFPCKDCGALPGFSCVDITGRAYNVFHYSRLHLAGLLKEG